MKPGPNETGRALAPGKSVFDTEGARGALRDLATGKLRENAYARLSPDRRSMPPWLFPTLVTGFALLRVWCILVLVAAWAGWFADPSSWATGAQVSAAHHTPFHGHPNLYGWKFGFQGLVGMHSVTGAALLAVCLVPLFAKKGGPTHKVFGRAFVGIWAVHLLNGLINSAHILLTRGFEPSHYLDSTKQGFSLYLYVQFAFISALVVDFLAHGMAALHYKNRSPSRVVRAVMLGLPASSTLLGGAMAVWAVLHLSSSAARAATPAATEYAVVYLVQVPAYVFLAAKNMAYWTRPEPRAWLQGWVTEHQRNMMFCVGVTLYTAAANVTMRFAPQLIAPIFASIDVGFVVWLLTKERFLRRDVVGGRLGLAIVSFLRRERSARPGSFDPRDAKWVLGMFDKNRNGALEPEELGAVLTAQGVTLTENELASLFRAVDRDGDGRIRADELADFLARGFASDPSRDEELAFCFRKLDADGDGRVSSQELRAAIDTLRRTQASRLSPLVERVGQRRREGFGFETFESAVESRRDVTPSK